MIVALISALIIADKVKNYYSHHLVLILDRCKETVVQLSVLFRSLCIICQFYWHLSYLNHNYKCLMSNHHIIYFPTVPILSASNTFWIEDSPDCPFFYNLQQCTMYKTTTITTRTTRAIGQCHSCLFCDFMLIEAKSYLFCKPTDIILSA